MSANRRNQSSNADGLPPAEPLSDAETQTEPQRLVREVHTTPPPGPDGEPTAQGYALPHSDAQRIDAALVELGEMERENTSTADTVDGSAAPRRGSRQA